MKIFSKKIIFIAIFLALNTSFAQMKNNIADPKEEKLCAFLKEESSKKHCKEEQNDEKIINQTKGKGYIYIQKNLEEFISNIKTVIGLQYFYIQLENQINNANILLLSKEEQKNELGNIRKSLDILDKKFNKLIKDYKNNLKEWNNNNSLNNEDEKALKSFVDNREKLLKELEVKRGKLANLTSSLNIFLQNKEVNKDVIMKIYLGEKVKVNTKDCNFINLNYRDIYKENINLLEGCKL